MNCLFRCVFGCFVCREKARRRGAAPALAASASVEARAACALFRVGAAMAADTHKMSEEQAIANLVSMRGKAERASRWFSYARGVLHTEVDANGVPCVWMDVPSASPHYGMVVLYFHGGGYTMGSAAQSAPALSHVLNALSANALIVDYRLAPEHSLAAGLEDAVRAFRWLVEVRGIAANRICVMGDSAGGGLAVRLCVKLRDSGLPMPACCVVHSPWLDLTMSHQSYVFNKERDAVNGGTSFPPHPLPWGSDDPKLFSPLCMPLHGLPPIMLTYSDDEMLADECAEFDLKVRQCGGTVKLIHQAEMPHGYGIMYLMLPEARQIARDIVSFFDDVMTTPGDASVAKSSSANRFYSMDHV